GDRIRRARRRRAAGGGARRPDAARRRAAPGDARDLPHRRDARRAGRVRGAPRVRRRRHAGAAARIEAIGRRGRSPGAEKGRADLMRGGVSVLLLLFAAAVAWAQEGVFIAEADAPKAVFRGADVAGRDDVVVTPKRRAAVTAALGGQLPSMWEERWIV